MRTVQTLTPDNNQVGDEPDDYIFGESERQPRSMQSPNGVGLPKKRPRQTSILEYLSRPVDAGSTTRKSDSHIQLDPGYLVFDSSLEMASASAKTDQETTRCDQIDREELNKCHSEDGTVEEQSKTSTTSQNDRPLSQSQEEDQFSDIDMNEVSRVLDENEDTSEEGEEEDDDDKEISDLKVNRWPRCQLPLPCLRPDSCNYVLFRAPLTVDEIPSPFPSKYKDFWETGPGKRTAVKMPCSPCNQIVSVKVVDGERVTSRESKWQLIEETLLGDGNFIKTSWHLEAAIKKFNPNLQSYNFRTLHQFFEDECDEDERQQFFSHILPRLIELTLQLPMLVTQPVPLLRQNHNQKLFISQQQIACLLANAFFSTYPKRSANSAEFRNFPDINFKSLMSMDEFASNKIEKLKCLMNYFRRVLKETPKGVVSFERRCLAKEEEPRWYQSTKKLSEVHVLSKGLIEKEGNGMLQVDFANKFVGGGVLDYGCVQEEIRFVICPELIVSRLFTEKLLDNEVLIITGCEQFNNYTGYGTTFKWAGNYCDETPFDEWHRRFTRVVAMDALYFSRQGKQHQYQIRNIDRELKKSFCAFMERRSLQPQNKSAIATGNWGCGAFNGDPMLKSIIQWMASSESERSLVYFTFGDRHFKSKLKKFCNFVSKNNLTVRHLYKSLQLHEKFVIENSKKNHCKIDIFKFIYDYLEMILS